MSLLVPPAPRIHPPHRSADRPDGQAEGAAPPPRQEGDPGPWLLAADSLDAGEGSAAQPSAEQQIEAVRHQLRERAVRSRPPIHGGGAGSFVAGNVFGDPDLEQELES